MSPLCEQIRYNQESLTLSVLNVFFACNRKIDKKPSNKADTKKDKEASNSTFIVVSLVDGIKL